MSEKSRNRFVEMNVYFSVTFLPISIFTLYYHVKYIYSNCVVYDRIIVLDVRGYRAIKMRNMKED